MQTIRKGKVLRDRYELDRPLGRGSMGQVWQGHDRHLERPVAIKLVAMELLADAAESGRITRRFEREAKAAAALDSANVATVYDADISDGLQWLVMQLVDGATLGMLLGERERFDEAATAAVAAQLCSGLAAVHAAGLVHRDLKPENVMVRRDGLVKILDFGLVKLIADDGPRLTATGERVGNLLYASPELLSGRLDLDGRSDLYSLGCLMHHMLSGEPPFPPDRPMAALDRRLREPPPSVARPGAQVPARLQDLIFALMAKRRQDRPASAAEVYDALGPWLPVARPGSRTLPGFGTEDPRRPFVFPQGPYPM